MRLEKDWTRDYNYEEPEPDWHYEMIKEQDFLESQEDDETIDEEILDEARYAYKRTA